MGIEEWMNKSITLRRGGFIFCIVALCVASYFTSLFNGFSYDDHYQVLENRWVKDWGTLKEVFSSDVTGFTAEGGTNYYRPLMYVAFMMVYSIFGLSPFAFHALNLAFHCAATVLVFQVAMILPWRREFEESDRVLIGLSAALVFAVHPVHSEAVMWVSALPDVACTVFSLLSLTLYLGITAGGGGVLRYALSLACYAVGLLFKEPAAMIPVAIISIDFCRRGGLRGLPWHRYVPYAAVTCVYLAVRYYAIGSFAPYLQYAELGSIELFLNQVVLFGEYAAKFLLPIRLSAYYVFEPVRSLINVKVIASGVFLVGFVLAVVFSYTRERGLLACLVLFALPLSPSIVFMRSIGGSIFAERYLYMPSVGLCLIFGFAVVMARRWVPKRAVAFTVGLLVCLSITAVVARAAVWKDDVALWENTLKTAGSSAMAHKCYALGLYRAGRVDEAIHEFEKSLKLNSGEWTTWYNLGVAYADLGKYPEAIASYTRAVQTSPSVATPWVGLGLAAFSLGQFGEAHAYCSEAVARNASSAAAHGCLGVIYGNTSLLDEAIVEFEIAVRLDPTDPSLRNNLAKALATKGRGK